ncbi:MAG: diguanylate cyclase [Anaerolineae bacterium]|nr:diguanylate cyclase [Anaerolineae bacterium]
MKSLTLRARIYIISVITLGVMIFVNCALTWLQWSPIMWLSMLMLGALSAVAQILKVEGATARSSYELSWVVWGFSLALYGPDAAAFTILVSYVAEWIWHKQKWFISCFNIGAFSIAIAVGNSIGSLIQDFYPNDMSAFIGSKLMITIVFTLLNHFLVGLVLWFARGENFAQSGVLNVFPVMLDLSTFGMGLAAAWVWMMSPVAVLTVLSPLYLIYTTLRVPALERQTQLDAKTGVFNAKYFNQALEKELARASRFNRPMTLVMADLDLLRNINNTYGHLAGDAVLIKIAEIIKTKAGELGVVARFGGEEFSILLPETVPHKAAVLIEAIRAEIESTRISIPTSPSPIRVTMSFGIACLEYVGQTTSEIVHAADLAVYQSKLNGRNQISFASPSKGNHKMPIDLSDQEGQANLLDNGLPALPTDVLSTPVPEVKAETPNKTEKAPVSTPHPVAHPPPLVYKRPPYLFPMLLTSMWMFTIGLFAHLMFSIQHEPDWLGITFFVVLIFLTEWNSIEIYAKGTNVSTSVVPILAGSLVFGPVGAVVFSLTQAVISFIKNRSHFNRLIFNTSNQMIGNLLCLELLNLIGNYAQLPMLLQALFVVLSMGVVYFTSTIMVSVAIDFDLGQNFIAVWKERFSWLGVYYLILGPVAMMLTYGYIEHGVVGAGLTMLPLAILRLSQTQYVTRTRDMVEQLRQTNTELMSRNIEIAELNEELLTALSNAVDLRDPYVHGHSEQVARYATLIAKELGLDAETTKRLHKAGLLHDIGKLGIPESILFKPAKLTPQEYALITKHATMGAEIVENCQSLRELAPFIRHHHERWDGQGYPAKLKGDEIPLEARILSAADAIEAMASDRPYRKAGSTQTIIEEIRRCSGTQFDPAVVNAFLKIIEREGEGIIINTARAINAAQSTQPSTPRPVVNGNGAAAHSPIPDFIPMPPPSRLQPIGALN